MSFLYRPILLVLIASGILLYVGTVTLPPRMLIQLGNYTLIWVAAAATIAYFAGFTAAVFSRRPGSLDFLTVGVVLGWLSVFMNRQWAQGLRTFPDAEWMRTSWFIAFYILIAVVAGGFHLLAGGSVDGRIPKRNLIWLGLVVGGGFATTAIIISLGWGEPGA